MKRILIVMLVLCHYGLQAQVSKGSLMVEGNVSFSKSHSSGSMGFGTDVTKSFMASPTLGYVFSDHFMAGISLEYAQSTTRTAINHQPSPGDWLIIAQSKVKSTVIAPGLYLKYYKVIQARFVVGARLTSQYGVEGVKIESLNSGGGSQSKLSNSFVAFSLSPEIQYFITNKVGVQTRMGGLKSTSFNRQMLTNESNLQTDFEFNLNPVNWEWGVVVLLK